MIIIIILDFVNNIFELLHEKMINDRYILRISSKYEN